MSSSEQSLASSRKAFFDTMEPSIAAMLKTDNAEVMSEADVAEILAYLLDYRDKNVLDLGAGIGRFTTKMSTVANHVTAVDISQKFTTQNQINNKNLTNITYICSDVTELDFPAGSFQMVFSSWILKYLTDEEITKLIARILKWLTPGGFFFFRESCFQETGTISEDDNPTIFRSLLHYCQLLHSVSVNNVKFKLLRGKNVQSFLHYQSAPNQVCFLAKKVESTKDADLSGLLEDRYSLQGITMMEKTFEDSWVYTGGERMVKDLLDGLGLYPSQRILEIGCGTGTSPFFLAKQYGVHVHGVDRSIAMTNLAIERQMKLDKDLRKMMQFEIGDILEMDFYEGFYDLIYSRECFLYITNKQMLFNKLYRWLRPGGVLLFTDFLKGSCPPSEALLGYLQTIKPCLPKTMDSYKQEMQAAGFKDVTSHDSGEQWIKTLQDVFKTFPSTRTNFVGDDTYHGNMCNLWVEKMEWINKKQLTWGVFRASK